VSALVDESPDFKRLWIRVLKRVHPDLSVDEQDRRRCERLTQQANDAYVRRDELALRAVLEPKGPTLLRYAPHDDWEATAQVQQTPPPRSNYQPPLAPQQPPAVIEREVFAILVAACAVLCLLLYGIFYALSETIGRKTSLFSLVLLTAGVLWLIAKHSKLSYKHKARSVAAVASGMILVAICLLDSRPRANPLFPSAHAATSRALAASVESTEGDYAPPSQWYWDVIKTRVGLSWNPSAVVDAPAGATADITFTISHDGSPRDVQVRKSSGYPSLDSSCVLAVQQVRTFGPPEGGARDSLNVLYPCSYDELGSMNARPPQSNTPQEKATVLPPKPDSVESSGAQLGAYIEAAKNKVAQGWNSSEVTGSIPAGATVYIQFTIRRRGNHGAPTMETSSGYSSLDASCLGAVDRIQTFDHLPKSYSGDSLTVVYHCTYPASSTTKVAQDSILPPVQQPPPSGHVDGVYGVQQPTNDTVVNN
jgi:TonB family protein